MLILIIFNGLGVIHFSKDTLKFDLIISSMLLFLPTITLVIRRDLAVRYVVVISTLGVCGILMSHYMEYTYILVTFPLIVMSMYYDKKLVLFSMLLGEMVVGCSSIIYELGPDLLLSRAGNIYLVLLQRTGIRLMQYNLFVVAEINFLHRSSKIYSVTFHDSNRLKRNRDGLDVIVDYTDALFCAHSYQQIAVIIFSIIKSLLDSLEKAPKNLEGCIGVREGKIGFYGINEKLESRALRIEDQHIMVKIQDEEYTIPLVETEENSTFFVDKSKITMFFYAEHKLVAFVILRTHLDETEEVLDKLLRVLYRNIRLAIRNIALTHDMYQTQEELVRAFSEISESKSGQTGSHIKRVSEYMKIMAEAINLDQKEKDSLVIASMMHDIGKLLIPENILEKPGKLTPQEFEVVKTHVHLGYKLLEYSPGRVMEIARIIALQHHEKWDGTGYLGMRG